MNPEIDIQHVQGKIHVIRGQRVMLDMDLAMLYQVETKQLKRAVKRNHARFPLDFVFEISQGEWENLRYQIGTSSWGGVRFFTICLYRAGRWQVIQCIKKRKGHSNEYRHHAGVYCNPEVGDAA
jgi:hypothetical protein